MDKRPHNKPSLEGKAWWCMTLSPVLGRQRQGDLCKFKESLVCISSTSTVRTTKRDHVSKRKKGRKKRNTNPGLM